MLESNIIQGDCLDVLKTLPSNLINTCVTSPPYWGLRDYGVDGQLGLEETPEEYVNKLVEVFREVRRVLRDDGTLWLNLGDSYSGSGKGAANYPGNYPKQNSNKGSLAVKGLPVSTPEGLKPKDLVGIPWMVAFALRADGWYLRSDIIWSKPNAMPEPVRDRPTRAHEYIFLLSKSRQYYYDHDSIKEPAVSDHPSGNGFKRLQQISRNGRGNETQWLPTDLRNKRSVWAVTTKPFKEAHFATFPPDLIEPCILAGCPENGIVLDPFFGSGTTGEVAMKHNRKFIGIELNPEYIEIAKRRLNGVQAVAQF